nr:uncharacterized protein LOC123749203 [Procambarus clarkii]
MKKLFLNPFHDRFSWASGYYEALPPTVTVDLNGTFTDWQPVVPVPVPKISCNCKDCNLNIKSSDIMCTFIMLSGMTFICPYLSVKSVDTAFLQMLRCCMMVDTSAHQPGKVTHSSAPNS